ncbi:MAG: GNAT family N-acetyltransferase [Myxococcales bacterium]|nr:GNAT family N-acetyltransferase [Myxococcales bacterium]
MITTARLLLRPLVPGDVPAIYTMSLEPALGKWIPDQVYRDEEHAEEVVLMLIEMATHRDPRDKPFVLGLEERETGALIGHVGLSKARGSVEIGYAIAERLHGRGLATEAVTAMTDWALRELGLPEVLGIVATANVSSCRVLEKAGYVYTGDKPAGIAVYRRTAA